MKQKILRTGTYTPPEDDSSSGWKTCYFPDGSAIIVTEKTMTLVASSRKYEVQPISNESA